MDHPIIFMDLETTGLWATENSVLSVGMLAADPNDLHIIDLFYEEYLPDQDLIIEMAALEYAGITLDEIFSRDHDFRYGIARVSEWLQKFSGKTKMPYVVNWRLQFDNSFLFAAAGRYGEYLPIFHKDSIDLRSFVVGYGYPEKIRMNELYKRLGGQPYREHHALDDATTALYIYSKLLDKSGIQEYLQ